MFWCVTVLSLSLAALWVRVLLGPGSVPVWLNEGAGDTQLFSAPMSKNILGVIVSSVTEPSGNREGVLSRCL